MKRAALIISIITIFCSSLAWGATERQEEIINKMNTFLEKEEAAYQTKENNEATDGITHSYWDLEAEEFSFLPLYQTSNNWKETLKDFVEKELELNMADLALTDESTYSATFKKGDGKEIIIERYDADCAAEYIRSVHFLANLNLKHIQPPKIEALARIYCDDDDILIAIEKPQGQRLFKHRADFLLSIFSFDNSAKMEQTTNIYHQLGLAIGELFSKSTAQSTLHPSLERSHANDLSEIQETLDNGPFMGITAELLNELYAHYQNKLQEKPILHNYHFNDADDFNFTYDTKTKTFSIANPEELLCSMDTEKKPNTPQFIAYYKTVTKLIDIPFLENDWEKEDFRTAFNRGYQESGCALPTPEEEKIYRFFNALSTLEEVINEEIFKWLWEQCQAE